MTCCKRKRIDNVDDDDDGIITSSDTITITVDGHDSFVIDQSYAEEIQGAPVENIITHYTCADWNNLGEDSSRNAYNATVSGLVGLPKHLGFYGVCRAESSGYMSRSTVADTNTLATFAGTAFSVSMFIQNYSALTDEAIIVYAGTGALSFLQAAGTGPLFYLQYESGGSTKLVMSTLVDTAADLARWNHFVFTWGPLGPKLYKNGTQLIASTVYNYEPYVKFSTLYTYTSTTPYDSLHIPTTMRIGYNGATGVPGNEQYMSQFILTDTVLTQTEVTELYTRGITRGLIQSFNSIDNFVANDAGVDVLSGSLTIPDSSNPSNPSLHFNSYPRTGLYQPAANQIGVSINGTQEMNISSTAVTLDTNSIIVSAGQHVGKTAGAHAATPSYSFNGDLNTGIYSPADGQVGISINGTEEVNVSSTAVTLATNNLSLTGGQILGKLAGSYAATPSYSFNGDLDTGIYSPAASQVGISIDSTEEVNVSSTAVTLATNNLSLTSGQILGKLAGAYAATPSYSFNGDLDTGIYSPAAGQVGISIDSTEEVNVSSTAVTLASNDLIVSAGQHVGKAAGSHASTPSYSFTSDLNTGIYSPANAQVAVSIDGTEEVNVSSTAVTLASNDLIVSAGQHVGKAAGSHASTPSYSFTSDLNTGIYSPANAQVAVSIDGTKIATVASTGLSVDAGQTMGYALIQEPETLTTAGSYAMPAYSFIGDTDTGMFSHALGKISFSSNAVKICSISSSGFSVGDGDLSCVDGQILGDRLLQSGSETGTSSGSRTKPTFSFNSDTDTGIYSQEAGRVSFSCNSTKVISITTAGIEMYAGQTTGFPLIQTPETLTTAGSYAMPAYSFSGDTNTGMYQHAADVISFSCGGTKIASMLSTGIEMFAGGLKLLTTGGTQGTLNYYEENYTSTVADSGPFTTTVNAVTYATRIGKMVTVEVYTMTGTMDVIASTLTWSGIVPSRLRPLVTVNTCILVRQTTLNQFCEVTLDSSGNLLLRNGISSGTFPANDVLTIPNITFSYLV